MFLCGVEYGVECCELFIVFEGWWLFGLDVFGFELCCLVNFMVCYDGGKYIDVVFNGDIYWVNV